MKCPLNCTHTRTTVPATEKQWFSNIRSENIAALYPVFSTWTLTSLYKVFQICAPDIKRWWNRVKHSHFYFQIKKIYVPTMVDHYQFLGRCGAYIKINWYKEVNWSLDLQWVWSQNTTRLHLDVSRITMSCQTEYAWGVSLFEVLKS